jgi:hypothetical protein
MALIIETAATHGRSGPARVGCYLLAHGDQVLASGFFLGPGARPEDMRALRNFGRQRALEPPLALDDLLALIFRYAYKKRLPLVAFELAAQLARLAADWGAPEHGSIYDGGISLILWTRPAPRRLRRGQRRLRNGQLEDGHRPRVLTKVLADGAAALAFAHRGQPDLVDRIPEGEAKPRKGYQFPGRFIPLERLTYGLAGTHSRTLEDACESLGIACPPAPVAIADEPLTPAVLGDCLARARAAHQLYLCLLARHQSFQLPLPADKVFSPASYAKASYKAIGITQPLSRYDGDLAGLGAAACASYGGWSGVGIRNTPDSPPTPVRLLDITGEYAVCAHQLGIWRLLCAERLTLTPVAPVEIEAWIGRQRRDTFRISPKLNVLCRLRPDHDVLPHRIKPGRTWLTTVAPLTCDESLWWPLSDLVNSFFETGKVPELEACLRLEGNGTLSDLRAIDLPGLGRFDPNQPGADLFLFLAQGRLDLANNDTLEPEERARLATLYKLWDNSACSGIFLEVHTAEPASKPIRGTVIGPDGPYETRAPAFEEPGPWYFPPFYALVTAAGRYLLNDGMRLVRDAGSVVAYWDTDSLAILATPAGGVIPVTGGRLRDASGRE